MTNMQILKQFLDEYVKKNNIPTSIKLYKNNKKEEIKIGYKFTEIIFYFVNDDESIIYVFKKPAAVITHFPVLILKDEFVKNKLFSIFDNIFRQISKKATIYNQNYKYGD